MQSMRSPSWGYGRANPRQAILVFILFGQPDRRCIFLSLVLDGWQ